MIPSPPLTSRQRTLTAMRRQIPDHHVPVIPDISNMVPFARQAVDGSI